MSLIRCDLAPSSVFSHQVRATCGWILAFACDQIDPEPAFAARSFGGGRVVGRANDGAHSLICGYTHSRRRLADSSLE